MKVYGLPAGFEAQTPDYTNYDSKKEDAAIERHKQLLRDHLREMGYKGKHTGKIVQFGVADGYAEYMLADGAGQYGDSFLFHLPYFDGYQYPDVQYMPKKAVVERIIQREKFDAFWAKKKESAK